MKHKLQINGSEIEVEVTSRTSNAISFIFEGKEYLFQSDTNAEGEVTLTDQNGLRKKVFSGTEGIYTTESAQYRIHKINSVSNAKSEATENLLKSPLPGKVIKVSVKVGAKVKKGDELVCIEAMKMEHRICAPIDGTVKSLYISEGENVTDSQELAEVSP